MTIAGKPIDGVKWYIKFTQRNIRCVYIDVTDMPDWLVKVKHKANDLLLCVNDVDCTFTFDDVFDQLGIYTGGGITYDEWGINERDYKTIEPSHKFLGWDYGHDIDVILGKKPPPTVAEIENHVQQTLKRIKDSLLVKSKAKWVEYFK